jgi:hypothetical protein
MNRHQSVGLLGPNIKRLIAIKMAKDAIPAGGGFVSGLRFLSSKENIVAGFKKASSWVQSVLVLVREAPEPNPWKTASDEEIAEHLVRRIEAKQTR